MRNLLILILMVLAGNQVAAQNLSSVLAQFNQDSLIKTVRELSGEDSVIINGIKSVINNRAAYIGSNLTEDYLKARLNAYKLEVQTQKYSINGLNVLGIQKGAKYPDEILIIGAHHDAVTGFCADDNASGVAAVMETARILSGKCFEYTIVYMFWDEEEAGLWGSTHHAKQSKAGGQVFRGIINMDMLGYDSNDDRKFDIHVYPESSSLSLADSVLSVIKRYNLNLDPQIINPGTDRGDHYSYWKQGITNAIACGERIFTDDPNPEYHKTTDRIGIFNIPYFAGLSKMTVGLTAALAQPCVTSVSDKIINSISKVEIFPNPTNGELTIKFNENLECRVIISDIAGRPLVEKICNQPVNSVNINHLPDGIYLISFHTKDGKITRKIVKTS